MVSPVQSNLNAGSSSHVILDSSADVQRFIKTRQLPDHLKKRCEEDPAFGIDVFNQLSVTRGLYSNADLFRQLPLPLLLDRLEHHLKQSEDRLVEFLARAILPGIPKDEDLPRLALLQTATDAAKERLLIADREYFEDVVAIKNKLFPDLQPNICLLWLNSKKGKELLRDVNFHVQCDTMSRRPFERFDETCCHMFQFLANNPQYDAAEVMTKLSQELKSDFKCTFSRMTRYYFAELFKNPDFKWDSLPENIKNIFKYNVLLPFNQAFESAFASSESGSQLSEEQFDFCRSYIGTTALLPEEIEAILRIIRDEKGVKFDHQIVMNFVDGYESKLNDLRGQIPAADPKELVFAKVAYMILKSVSFAKEWGPMSESTAFSFQFEARVLAVKTKEEFSDMAEIVLRMGKLLHPELVTIDEVFNKLLLDVDPDLSKIENAAHLGEILRLFQKRLHHQQR